MFDFHKKKKKAGFTESILDILDKNNGDAFSLMQALDEVDRRQREEMEKLDEHIPQEDEEDELDHDTTVSGMSIRLTQYAAEHGLVKKRDFLFIPEVMMTGQEVCKRIFLEGRTILEELHVDTFGDMMYNFVNWCTFAGIGAVLLWDKDWPSLQKRGVVDSIIENGKVSDIDDIVIEKLLRIPINKRKAFGESLTDLRMQWYVFFGEEAFKEDILQAYYNFGMTYAMNVLGLYEGGESEDGRGATKTF